MTEPAAPGSEDPLTKPFDLQKAFLAKQNALRAALGVTIELTSHGTTIGDASEANWTAMLTEFLPGRYGVGPVFAVDSRGRQSQQIDVAVYDRHYAPLWFRSSGGTLIVPVESIYAAFEVKPEINKTLADYTGNKIASVRALHRTSAAIRHAGGLYDAQDPEDKPILGGLLAVRSGWTDIEGKAAVEALTHVPRNHRIDFGIALETRSFSIAEDGTISFSKPGTQLIYFVMRLFERLQELGTALAIEIDQYEAYIGGTGTASATTDGEVPRSLLP